MTDPKIAEIIRVNHAGELGAQQIYEGQIKFLKDLEAIEEVKKMKDQEYEHFKFFDEQVVKNGTRPTILYPLWKKLGFALGAVTGFCGKEVSMACTVAVEEVIEEHYQEQIDYLKSKGHDKELLAKIEKFQKDEIEHKETGIQNDGLDAPIYPAISFSIKTASKIAIWLSKKF